MSLKDKPLDERFALVKLRMFSLHAQSSPGVVEVPAADFIEMYAVMSLMGTELFTEAT